MAKRATRSSSSKKTKSAVAILLAAVIALSGTFAWQSISQQALNEAKTYRNPGGRLHDDFSGWQKSVHNQGVITKDIYVENYGTQTIYARVRLDEYMEIGVGAGLKAGEFITGEKTATSLVAGASIDDPTTWKTHIPGDTVSVDKKPTTGYDAKNDFHTYWTWVMGGQAEDNKAGKTVYMPTFNKNGDSLAADINGTLNGGDPDAVAQYGDWVNYKVGDEATRVRNEDKDGTDYVIPTGAFFDADEDTVSEGDVNDPLNGMYGNGGIEGDNYTVVTEDPHKAKETDTCDGVITMAVYNGKTAAEKTAFKGWVYDEDGWAYWSQPIVPGDGMITTATGLLMDRLDGTDALKSLTDDWYYGINAVAQFITADDLGRGDSTGFYEDPNREPSVAALALLKSIGVDTGIPGSISVQSEHGANVTNVQDGLKYALVPDFQITRTAADGTVTTTKLGGTVNWTLTGAAKSGTKINATDGKTTITFKADKTTIDQNGATELVLEAGETGDATTNTLTITAVLEDAVDGSGKTYSDVSQTITVNVMSVDQLITKLATESNRSETVTIDDKDWYVLALTNDLSNGSGHWTKAALLLSKDVLVTSVLGDDTSIQTALTGLGDATSGALNATNAFTISSHAIEVETQLTADGSKSLTSKYFLLSRGDVEGLTAATTSASDWEYSYPATGNFRLPSATKIAKDTAATPAATAWWTRTKTADGKVGYYDATGTFTTGDPTDATLKLGIRPALWYGMEGYELYDAQAMSTSGSTPTATTTYTANGTDDETFTLSAKLRVNGVDVVSPTLTYTLEGSEGSGYVAGTGLSGTTLTVDALETNELTITVTPDATAYPNYQDVSTKITLTKNATTP